MGTAAAYTELLRFLCCLTAFLTLKNPHRIFTGAGFALSILTSRFLLLTDIFFLVGLLVRAVRLGGFALFICIRTLYRQSNLFRKQSSSCRIPVRKPPDTGEPCSTRQRSGNNAPLFPKKRISESGIRCI